MLPVRDWQAGVVVLALVGGFCWLSWSSAYSAGVHDGTVQAQATARAERAPSLEQARQDAIAELTAPVGQATCSVVSSERVIPKVPCVKVALGGYLIPGDGK